jgi:hypothetical protein
MRFGMVKKLKEFRNEHGGLQTYKTIVGTLIMVMVTIIGWTINKGFDDIKQALAESSQNSKAIVAINENQKILIQKIGKHEDRFDALAKCIDKNKTDIIRLKATKE